jgi:6-pyruvoyltetrahydropterin/6-carboxytetrahydropterin synthase
MEIRKRFKFEAAHVLPHHPGKCRFLHGHSYRLEVALRGPLQREGPAAGMVLDFDELKQIVTRLIIDELDHRSLNDLLPNPTAELIAAWVWERLAPALPALHEVVLWETVTSCAVVRRELADAGAG